jgi:hypothetical protein
MATEDLEIGAMSTISRALADLDEDARRRVLDWASKRYSVKLAFDRSRRNSGDPDGADEGERDQQQDDFGVFADLFDATGPRSEAERALVGGYWFQVVEGSSDFQGQSVNNALKDVGHGVSNITVALGNLQERKPALVRQVSKSGRSKQARKKYKLTSAGISAVETMLRGGGDE